MEADEYKNEMQSKIGEIFIRLLHEAGLLHDRDLRNIKVRADYKAMIESGISKLEARKILADRPYYNMKGQKYYLSEDTITNIVYGKSGKKNG